MRTLTGPLLITSLALTVGLTACHDERDDPTPPPPPPIEPEPVTCSGGAIDPERLYLQQLGTDSVIIKWRGNREESGAEADTLCFGTDMNALLEDSQSGATVTATGHSEVLLTDLDPDTTYYYSVGGAGTADAKHHFTTSPEFGSLPADGNTRIWLVGDSGVAGEPGKPEAGFVRDGYLSFVDSTGGEAADLFVMLGDNAYTEGTDLQHQGAIFDLYVDVLKSTPVWPTIGNHEMGRLGGGVQTSTDDYETFGAPENGGPDPAPDSPMPYLNIFTLPTGGEIGGLASGTEQYYSFNSANVHIVSLDSQVAARDEAERAAMRQWLEDDLMANTQDWTIVIFHHPPYTMGSHSSDKILAGIDQPIFAMREEFTPLMESYGVDLVYSGHSHVYERSYYLKDHTGLSDTFDPALHAELNDDGVPANGQGNETYTQITRDGVDNKVVYTVAGSSGKATYVQPEFPHVAHFFSLLDLGSVVIDLSENELTANFIDINGDVVDSFTMTR